MNFATNFMFSNSIFFDDCNSYFQKVAPYSFEWVNHNKLHIVTNFNAHGSFKLI